MPIGAKPPADLTIDEPLVRGLLAEQHPDLAHLDLLEVEGGWDNTLFRLGQDLVIRLPRRSASASLIGHEQRWLPLLSPRLPLPVPVALRVGHPSDRFPWSWSITSWFAGRPALVTPPQPAAAATTLGGFLRALHQPAPPDAPRNPWRGVPLTDRSAALSDHLQRIGGLVDRAAVVAFWDVVLSTPPWPGPDRHYGFTATFIPAICWSTTVNCPP
jgi:aminoglycoside phosphotransferase (APT) family kinase protein